MTRALDLVRKSDVTNSSIGFLPVKLDIPRDPTTPTLVPAAQGTRKRNSLAIDPVLAVTLPFPDVRSIRTESDFHFHIGAVPVTHQVGESLPSGGGGAVFQGFGRSEFPGAWLDFNPHQPISRKAKKKAIPKMNQTFLLAEDADHVVAH